MIKKILLWISRIFLGIVFVFSGFVKLVDPTGSQIKFTDYFFAFNIEWMAIFSIFIAFVLSAIEFMIGLSLIVGAKGKLNALGALLLMLFFTPLTLYIAIYNPVSDCGCFGDAIKIDNWGTFYKNLILLPMSLIIFAFRKDIKPIFCKKNKQEWFMSLGIFTAAIVFAGYNLINLPILDFRQYKEGTDIGELMKLPPDAKKTIVEMVFEYKNKKTGEKKEFSEKDLSTINYDEWEYVDRKDKIIQEGDLPPINDFSLENKEGKEVTDSFITQKGYRLVIVEVSINKVSKKTQTKINKFVEELKVPVWGLASGLWNEINKYKENNDVKYDFCVVDKIVLQAMIRSNPGIILFKDNVVVKKWSSCNCPDTEEIKSFMK